MNIFKEIKLWFFDLLHFLRSDTHTYSIQHEFITHAHWVEEGVRIDSFNVSMAFLENPYGKRKFEIYPNSGWDMDSLHPIVKRYRYFGKLWIKTGQVARELEKDIIK